MKVQQLLDSIAKNDLVLPEFQREYVWTKEKAKQLMISLLKDYPVGSLLLWDTTTPPELKNIKKLPEHLGSIHVILDGQQRLTSLYLLLKGEIPPFYKENEIENDPRDLYYNISDRDFQYYQGAKMQNNPLWISVVDCFNNGNIPTIKIAIDMSGGDQNLALQLAQLYSDNLSALKNITNIDLTVQSVPMHASLEDAIDIFDRVNSLGTKLTDAELALTHITGKWSQARRLMKSKITSLERNYFYFDLAFMTRSLTCIVTKHAAFDGVHPIQKKPLEKGWEDLIKILDYLVSILPSHAHITSTQDLNTTNILVPIISYLSLNKSRFPNASALKRAIHWIYAAQVWARYSSQTDQKLEADLSIITREENPWEGLVGQIIEQRGRIELKNSDLDGHGAQNPLYRMIYILAKAQGAVDWFNGLPLGTNQGKSYSIHSHHIFPTSRLYEAGFNPDNIMHRSVVNEVANRAFLTADTNLELRNRFPEDYLPEVESNYPGALAHQFIPMDPVLWKIDRYRDFLDARRTMIATKINEFMDGLVKEPVILHKRPIIDLIKLGESETLEFKSTFQWDVVQNQQNKDLRKSVLKTLVAFLNSQGGTLVIGVEDDGNIYGLEKDLALVSDHSKDKFANMLSSLIIEKIGAEFSPYIKLRFEELNSDDVCVLDVIQASTPAFFAGDKGSEFFIRVGPTSRLLDPQETVNYIHNKWG